VSLTTAPLVGVATLAARRGAALERRVVSQVFQVEESEPILIAAFDSPRVQRSFAAVLDSQGTRRLVELFFESGVFDELVDQLLASPALWRLVDELASSPAVTRAISQQGLGFADQMGDEVRRRSRRADDWLDRKTRRRAARNQAPVTGAPAQEPS
jgi:hypothetical protein